MRSKKSSTKHVDNARTRIIVEYFRTSGATLVRVRRISRYPHVRERETLSGWRTVLLCDTYNAQRATTLHAALMCRVDAASHYVTVDSQRWEHAHCRAVKGSVDMTRYQALYAELCDIVRESMELSGVTNPNVVDARDRGTNPRVTDERQSKARECRARRVLSANTVRQRLQCEQSERQCANRTDNRAISFDSAAPLRSPALQRIHDIVATMKRIVRKVESECRIPN